MTPVADLGDAVRDADYVVEAVLRTYRSSRSCSPRSRSTCRPDTILASNTSVIPITDDHAGTAASANARSAPIGGIRLILVPLVEVIETQWTTPEAVDFTMKLHADAGKKPAHVKKDVPGFIGNRLQHALWREAVSLVEQGICDAETVDTVIKAAFGRRLAVLGPLENADMVGTDLTLAIHNDRVAGDRQPAWALALSRKTGRGGQARLQIRRRLPQMERGAAGGLACESTAASEESARARQA